LIDILTTPTGTWEDGTRHVDLLAPPVAPDPRACLPQINDGPRTCTPVATKARRALRALA
jgi:hypothetical protein